MDIKRIILVLACIFTLLLCSTVSAADTNNITSNNSNSSFNSLQSSTSINSDHNQPPDPIISGVVTDNSTNKGLGNVTIKVLQNNTQVAQTTTSNDGTYSLNFTNSNTNFTIIASKLGYMPISKTITVKSSSDPCDTNLYGTANFRLYKLLTYSGNASGYVLNVGALPDILLDIYAGKSSAWVNSTSSPYATGGGTSLEIKLLGYSLLSGLLDVYSTGDDGTKAGGLLPSTNSTLNKILNDLGLDVSLLSAYSNSSAYIPSASGTGDLSSINLDIKLLDLIKILGLNVGAIGSSSSVIPDFNTGVLISTSSAGVANITVTLLGEKLLEIEALQTVATASVNGKPGGASATFNWQVASIKLKGVVVDLDQLKAGIEIPGILKLSLGSLETITSPDGTYAKVSGDALRLQVLQILGGGLVNLVIGHVEAEAQVPVGGLHVTTSDLTITKTADNTTPNYLQNVTFTIKVHNNGPDATTNVKVTDKLPTGLKFISSNGNYDPNTGTWNIGNLANGADATLQIVAQVVASNTQITNTAGITEEGYDPEPGNDQSNVTINVGAASDLGITKTVNNTTPNYQDQVTFTIKVHNNGPDTTTGVTVTDKLPSGLTWVKDDSNGAYNPTTGKWTISSLTSGSDAILNIVAQVIASNTQITNIAGINQSNYDPELGNDQANATVTVNAASDLTITKTVNNTRPNYQDQVTFTIKAHNNGPDTATGVTVLDKLPTGLKFISTNGDYNPTTGIWTVGTLTNGGEATLKIIAQIIASNTQITNIASINGTNYDQNTTNNESNTTVTVDPASDLTIIKTVNNTHPKYLQNITYTLKVHNNGPDASTGTIVLDKLPAGLKFISSDGNYDPTTGIWTIRTLTNGTNTILNIIAQVIASNTTITNIASINGTNYDQNTTNNESNTTITVDPASDLGITKTANNSHPNYLDNVTFTLKVHNNGPDTATGVTVLDKLPTGLKFISSNGDYNPTTGIWTVGTLINDGEATLKIIAQVIASNTQITNIASINGTNYDQDPNNNQSNTTIIVNAASDLTIIKTVNNTHPKYLQNITYTLKVHNNGPDDATGVTATDKLPNGLKFISTNGDGKYDSTTGIWTIGNLANGSEVTLNIIAQVIASNTQITNIAGVNGTTYDQNSTNNQSNTTINVDLASDLGIIKTVNNSKPNYLQNVIFTLTAHNYGLDNATGVKVTDKLPNGLKFVSVSGDGTYDSTNGIWTIGSLANGATAVLNIVAQAVNANTPVVNTASITGTNYDQNSANDQSSATVNIKPASDLGIKITVDNAHPAYKDYVTFTLTATNAGPNDAAYVKVYNTLPNKLRYVSDDSSGAFNSTTGLWIIGYMANGATATLKIVAQAMTSNVILTDIARITDPDPVGTTDFYDPNQDNDQASVTLGVSSAADLSITKSVDNTHPNYLDKVTFTIKAHNNGPDAATNVKVTDYLPNGLKFISTNENYNPNTGTWNIGNLASGTDAFLQIVAQVVASNTQITNTANINGNELDLDPTNNNANAAVSINAASDLGITKTVNNACPKYLQKVTFTLTAHNYGPDAATGVTVTDKLPNGLKFVSTNGNYNPTTGTWNIRYLSNGATAVLQIVAQATAPNTKVTNTATVNGDNYDQKYTNNNANAAVKIGPAADLAVKMSVSNAHPKYKQKVTFTITAYNYGPMDAKNVTVKLKMPKGLKYISKDRNIKYNPKTGIWTIGNLKNGAKVVLHVVEQATVSKVRLTTIANITGTAIMK